MLDETIRNDSFQRNKKLKWRNNVAAFGNDVATMF